MYYWKLSLLLVAIYSLGCQTPQAQKPSAELTEKLKLDRKKYPGQSIQDFFKDREFTDVRISNDGKYLAVGFENNGRVELAVLERQNYKFVYRAKTPTGQTVVDFGWLNHERLYMTVRRKTGSLTNESSFGKVFCNYRNLPEN